MEPRFFTAWKSTCGFAPTHLEAAAASSSSSSSDLLDNFHNSFKEGSSEDETFLDPALLLFLVYVYVVREGVGLNVRDGVASNLSAGAGAAWFICSAAESMVPWRSGPSAKLFESPTVASLEKRRGLLLGSVGVGGRGGTMLGWPPSSIRMSCSSSALASASLQVFQLSDIPSSSVEDMLLRLDIFFCLRGACGHALSS